MNYNDLTAAEKLVLTSFMSTVYRGAKGITYHLPLADMPRLVVEGAIREGSFLTFRERPYDIVDFGLLVAEYLSDGHIERDIPSITGNTGGESVTTVRKIIRDKYEADLTEMQAEYDASTPDEFAKFYRYAVVSEGKVVDPWGSEIGALTRWWCENLTINMIAVIHTAVMYKIREVVEGALSAWMAGHKENDPQKVAADTFRDGMEVLCLRLKEQTK